MKNVMINNMIMEEDCINLVVDDHGVLGLVSIETDIHNKYLDPPNMRKLEEALRYVASSMEDKDYGLLLSYGLSLLEDTTPHGAWVSDDFHFRREELL